MTDQTEREKFKVAHQHLDLAEDLDAWGRPKFKHSHVDAMHSGWQARAALDQPAAPGAVGETFEQWYIANPPGETPVGKVAFAAWNAALRTAAPSQQDAGAVGDWHSDFETWWNRQSLLHGEIAKRDAEYVWRNCCEPRTAAPSPQDAGAVGDKDALDRKQLIDELWRRASDAIEDGEYELRELLIDAWHALRTTAPSPSSAERDIELVSFSYRWGFEDSGRDHKSFNTSTILTAFNRRSGGE
jgi:hypothetical protein